MGSTTCCVSSLTTPKEVPGVHPWFASIRYPMLFDGIGSGVGGLDVVGVSWGMEWVEGGRGDCFRERGGEGGCIARRRAERSTQVDGALLSGFSAGRCDKRLFFNSDNAFLGSLLLSEGIYAISSSRLRFPWAGVVEDLVINSGISSLSPREQSEHGRPSSWMCTTNVVPPIESVSRCCRCRGMLATLGGDSRLPLVSRVIPDR